MHKTSEIFLYCYTTTTTTTADEMFQVNM